MSTGESSVKESQSVAESAAESDKPMVSKRVIDLEQVTPCGPPPKKKKKKQSVKNPGCHLSYCPCNMKTCKVQNSRITAPDGSEWKEFIDKYDPVPRNLDRIILCDCHFDHRRNLVMIPAIMNLVEKLKKKEAELNRYKQGMRTFLNDDQIKVLIKDVDHVRYTPQTYSKAIEMCERIGYAKYEYLLKTGYPSPSVRSIQRFKEKMHEIDDDVVDIVMGRVPNNDASEIQETLQLDDEGNQGNATQNGGGQDDGIQDDGGQGDGIQNDGGQGDGIQNDGSHENGHDEVQLPSHDDHELFHDAPSSPELILPHSPELQQCLMPDSAKEPTPTATDSGNDSIATHSVNDSITTTTISIVQD